MISFYSMFMFIFNHNNSGFIMFLKHNVLRMFLLAGIIAAPSFALADTVKTNVHDFMEDYAKPLDKLAKKGNAEPLQRFLQQLPELATEKDKKEWQDIVDKAIAEEKMSSSCRACHSVYKRAYGKANRDRVVEVPAELVAYLKESLK